MADVLIVYGSNEGQTGRIAGRIAARLREHGHGVTVLDAGALPRGFAPERFAAVLLAGSVHYGRHPRRLVRFARAHRAFLESVPAAFVSVSLTSRRPDWADRAERLAAKFVRRTGWRPARIATFAGALPYSRYNAWQRLMVRTIMGVSGGPTDTRHDYEFTDWTAVERFGDAFAEELPEVARARVRAAR